MGRLFRNLDVSGWRVIDHRLRPNIDWVLLALVLLLAAIGLATIYSATFDPATQQAGPEFSRQILALVLGLVALAVCLRIDYRRLASYAALFYVGLVALLAGTLHLGVEASAARRWIDVGPFSVQPSEFSRMVIAFVLAALYAETWRRPLTGWVTGACLVAVPFVLIARGPDLGAAITLLSVCFSIMIFAGLRLKVLAAFVLAAVLMAPVAWTYSLEDYQKERIISFFDPEQDPQGAGYQQIQARITVGSGGLAGKGFLQGTQSQYNFLPVAHNDFIFAVLAEEQGFLGVVVVLGLYLFVIVRSLETARLARDRMGALLVVGITAGFAFQVIYNVAMAAGLAPVKGLTLPLMSSGGSSIIATLMGFGFILNVRMHRLTN